MSSRRPVPEEFFSARVHPWDPRGSWVGLFRLPQLLLVPEFGAADVPAAATWMDWAV